METIEPHSNVVCIAGGTWIYFVMPVLLCLSQSALSVNRKLRFIWIIRREGNMKWVQEELRALQRALQQAPEDTRLDISVFFTRNVGTKIELSVKAAKMLESYIK
ncbi:hypothetical protein J3F83DRAFT_385350 [Trichoderma novae-zelandiae]